MMFFVTALFADNGDFLECAAGELPIWPEGSSLFDKPHSSCGVVLLKTGVNPSMISRYVEPDGQGGARFKDTIGEIAQLCCRRTPATTELLAEKLCEEGCGSMHILARTWLAERLPTEKAGYFGTEIVGHSRALPTVRNILEKKYNKDALPTGFKKFERAQVAKVHERIAADSAWQEMIDATNEAAP
jgi:hypothetical protein